MRYIRQCLAESCACKGSPLEVVMRAADFGDGTGIKCPSCGGPTCVHPDQFGTTAVEREWKRAQGGIERNSMSVMFAADADVESIKRDCPSMELARGKFGELRPVSRNDKHDRRWKGEMARAVERYQAQDAITGNQGAIR